MALKVDLVGSQPLSWTRLADLLASRDAVISIFASNIEYLTGKHLADPPSQRPINGTIHLSGSLIRLRH